MDLYDNNIKFYNTHLNRLARLYIQEVKLVYFIYIPNSITSGYKSTGERNSLKPITCLSKTELADH